MGRSLTKDEYVRQMDNVAVARCAVTIRDYFHGNVARFYNAFDNFNKHGSNPGDPKYDSAWKDLRRYNLAGIENRFVQSVFGKNYHNPDFMKEVWDVMENSLHYKIVRHGVLVYKGKRHPYFTKYLPPMERMEAIFANKQEVERIISPSSYCNKVKKILNAIMTGNSEKAGLDVSKWGGGKQPNVPFNSPFELLDELRLRLFTYKAGTPGTYMTVVQTILSPDLYEEVRKEWVERIASDVLLNNKFTGDWKGELSKEELITVSKNIVAFLVKVKRQLDGPYAPKMFKDEYAGKDNTGNAVWKPADEKRVAKALSAVEKAITEWKARIQMVTVNAAD